MHSSSENNSLSLELKINPNNLDFELPESLIAQEPVLKRDQARMLVVRRATGEMEHRLFADIIDVLQAGDVLVINKAQVNRAKLNGQKATGGRVSVIFLRPTADPTIWSVLLKPSLKEGTEFFLHENTRAIVVGRSEWGDYFVRLDGSDPQDLMKNQGQLPLPPYIKRSAGDPRTSRDQVEYQTVYASAPGSVAAPTAGLHFTESLMKQLKERGIQFAQVVLHVGWGTFKPVAGDVKDHQMLPEQYEITPETYQMILEAKNEKRRIFAVGTTTTRVLESLPLNGVNPTLQGETNLFIRPGFQFRWVDGLITNFHVPRSSPIALTAAFVGLEKLEETYAEAIRKRYRFFSYGDAMLIL